MYIQLAWRNIWRNPRRTGVILTAVIIGVWTMVFLGALMDGVNDQIIKNSISTLTGNIQIHHPDYRDDPVIENSMHTPDEIKAILNKNLPKDAFWASRIRVSAVASNARHSAGITMVGIEPEKEADVSFIAKSIAKGKFLKSDDKYGIIVGQALLDKFETRLGKKLVLMSQASDKEMVSRAFRIVGVFRAELEATEKAFVFVNLPEAGKMLKMGKSISEISIMLKNSKIQAIISQKLKAKLSENYAVETWEELLPVITAYVKLNEGFNIMWNFVVFVAMGFGIVNTMLMAVFERMREFGLLKALGMKPWWIVREVMTESFFILIIGIIIGNIFSLICIFALSNTGIDLSSFAAAMEYAGMPRIIYPVLIVNNLILANMIVLFLGLIVSIYPALKAAKFTPVKAMTHY